MGEATCLANYTKGQVLGQGAFGKVFLATDNTSKQTVAIKEVSKKQIQELGKVRHIFREKNLLNEMDHPFIIKLVGTDQDDNSLFFIFENCANGDLANLIQQRGK